MEAQFDKHADGIAMVDQCKRLGPCIAEISTFELGGGQSTQLVKKVELTHCGADDRAKMALHFEDHAHIGIFKDIVARYDAPPAVPDAVPSRLSGTEQACLTALRSDRVIYFHHTPRI